MNDLFLSLMQDFGNAAGLTDLQADEDGGYYLLFDDLAITIHLIKSSATAEEDAVLLSACVGVLPLEQRETFCLTLLDANKLFVQTDGATLAVNSAQNLVFLQRAVPLQSLDLKIFMTMLESFVNQTELWTRFCSEQNATGETETTEEPLFASETVPSSATTPLADRV